LSAETPVGPAAGVYLALAYPMVCPLMPLGLATFYATHSRQFVDYYWIVVLLATYVCLAITPFVRAIPPRALDSYETFRMPPVKVRSVQSLYLVPRQYPGHHISECTRRLVHGS